MNWDALINENRGLIAYIFPLIGIFTLVSSSEGLLPGFLAFNPWLLLFGILVMRSPLLVGIAPVMSKRFAIGLVFLTAYTYLIEYIGVLTGWPYGTFAYEISLGPMINGVPVALPVLFLPLVVNAYLLGVLTFPDSRWRRVPFVIVAVIAMDVVLDPGAVSVGFWSYANPGFYGVAWTNFLGWFLSATMTVIVLEHTVPYEALYERLRSTPFILDDIVSFVLFWGGINAIYQNEASFLLACGFGLYLWYLNAFDMPSLANQRWIFT